MNQLLMAAPTPEQIATWANSTLGLPWRKTVPQIAILAYQAGYNAAIEAAAKVARDDKWDDPDAEEAACNNRLEKLAQNIEDMKQ